MEELSVKQYTKADFNSEEPYKVLFALRNNRFKYNQVFTILKENASSVGFKDFGRMLKSYAEEQAGRGVIIDNVTQFDGQLLELKTGEWLADDCAVTRRNERNGEDIACVHPIMPVECLSNIDTGIEKLRIAFKKGRYWRNEIYERRTIASANNILELANNGVAVTSETSKYLVRYLHDIENLNIDVIPQHKSVGRLGWTNNDGFSPYVDDLIFDGANNFKNIYDCVKAEGSFDEWLKLAKKVRETDSPAKVLMAASFASVLLKVLGKLNFMVHLWGGTESGKTVSLMLAASIWANPAEDGYIQTFNGTQVAIELLEGFTNSMPLILDEFQLVKDKKMFEGIVYMICEGIGRLRGKKTGGLQDTPTWKNCTLTSGESPITNASSGGGAVNRIIEIECRSKLFDDAPAVADVVRKNYGHAGKIFVMLLSNEGAKEEAVRLYKEFYNALGTDSTEKQTMAAAVLLTADALATKWIFSDNNALKIEDIDKYLHSKESVDVNLRAYEYLKDTIASNHYKFIINGTVPNYECWGSLSGGKTNLLKTVFEKICTDGGYDSKALASWMKQRGLTEYTENREFKKVSINSTKLWCICMVEPDTEFEPVEQMKIPFPSEVASHQEWSDERWNSINT
jgi:uncharacterized protein (DUF927 family)